MKAIREWLSGLWFRFITRPILQRKVRNAGLALVYVNHMMIQHGVGRKLRRQFMRDLWRRPVSAYEIIERGLYGRVGRLEAK